MEPGGTEIAAAHPARGGGRWGAKQRGEEREEKGEATAAGVGQRLNVVAEICTKRQGTRLGPGLVRLI